MPTWLAAAVVLLAAWALLDRLLVPGVRWFLRRRVERALEEVNQRLQLRIQPFKLTKRRVLIDRLVYDRQVVATAEETSSEEGAPREVVMARVERYADEIVPAFNAYLYFRFGYWLGRNVARTLYRVRVGVADPKALMSVDRDATVVFVMNHRSNMDYVLVSYLAAERTALSYAVGEWARIWPLETLIRSMGAYFVRRRSRNALYRKVLERYVGMASREGVTQAVYPEGGLSRDGRLQPPKLGLLDYMLRGFDREAHRDIVFVPVGINYDRVLEDRTLLLDTLDDAADRPGALAALGTTLTFIGNNIGLWLSGRWHRFGYACVNFGVPTSARRFLEDRDLDLRTESRAERFARIAELADELMCSVGAVVPVTPVALVATALVENEGRSLSELELKGEVQGLIERLEEADAMVYIPRQDRDYAIGFGLQALAKRHLVVETDGLYGLNPDERPVIAYYANSIAHLLADRRTGTSQTAAPPST